MTRVERTTPAIAAALEELGDRLRAHFGDRLLEYRLFGSHARGEANEDSDVDVFVLLDEVTWTERRRIIDMATDVGLGPEVRLAPTVFDRSTFERFQRQERPLATDIDRDGIRL